MSQSLPGFVDYRSKRRPAQINITPMQTELDTLQSLMKTTLQTTVVESFDGTRNNQLQPTWGAAHTALHRMASSAYANSVNTLATRGASNPSPRLVSNAVCAMPPATLEPSTLHLSNMTWLWGQFIDHAITLTDTNNGEPANVLTSGVDPNEEYPNHTIMFARSQAVSGSSPREQPNVISAFLDGTHVYGTSFERATALRRLDGSGKLKTSAGDLLPYNTNGLPNAAPPNSTASDFFLAGDIRANENACLTALHTLFVREHNRQCDAIEQETPQLSGNDEQLYQRARHRVNALVQHVTYDAYLPSLLGSSALPVYSGYKPYVLPSIATEFSTVGYRLGHAMIPSLLQVGPLEADTALLRTLFFTPAAVVSHGVDELLQGASRLVMKEINTHIVDDLRNFLFGAPANNMLLDLATLNMQRARDHGIPSYNAVRTAYNLSTATTYADVTSNVAVQAALGATYDTPGDVDPWLGGLAEDHVSGGAVGELVQAILVDQFTRIRDGDRFWYENNVALTAAEKNEIKATTLADIIRRNTALSKTDISDDVFHI